MLTSLHQPLEQFVKQFMDKSTPMTLDTDDSVQPFIPLTTHSGDSFNALLRYFSRGGETSVEEFSEYYPCVVIQDFQPSLDSTRMRGIDFLDGFYDPINHKVIKEYLPIPYKFRFQVSSIGVSIRH